MEKYLLENFQKELSQIKEYIKHIQQVNNLVGLEVPDESVFQEFKTHFLSFRNDKKLFEYKAIIISLYGLLEKYIDIWLQAYLTSLSKLVSYDNLSDDLKNKHFKLTMKLIEVIIEGKKAKYSHLKKEDVLKKLNNCVENPQLFEFNVDAFTMQSGNLTHSRIEDVFKAIDIIIGKELVKNVEVNSLTGIPQPQNTEGSVLYSKINELVERRNTIAHGANIDDLLDLSAIDPYIEFLEKYCVAVFCVLEEKNIENHTIEKYQQFTCQGVFAEKTVIGVSLENYTIKRGDWIIIKTADQGNQHFYKKEIKSLGKDGKNDYSQLIIEEINNVAIGIENQESLPITTQCLFYLKRLDTSVV